MRFALLTSLLTSLLVISCGDSKSSATDATTIDSKTYSDAPIDAADPNNPLTLFETGLCVDRACTAINADIHTYTPQFALWADTATKKRWYWLPPGSQIDTSNMDYWNFPMGTKFWKEFTRDGVRVETRLEMKIGPGDTVQDWFYISYAWNEAQTDTMQVPTGVQNANGTQHDIPSRVSCKGCHENLKPTRILGFGAIQLDHAAVTAGDDTLASLIAAGTLTTNPTGSSPYFPIEGNAQTKVALGYIFANCSHCHNPSSSVHDQVPMELRMTVATLGAHKTSPPYLTAVNHYASQPTNLVAMKKCKDANNVPNNAECIIAASDTANSAMLVHFNADPNTSLHMPALGSEMEDPAGLAALTNWINNADP